MGNKNHLTFGILMILAAIWLSYIFYNGYATSVNVKQMASNHDPLYSGFHVWRHDPTLEESFEIFNADIDALLKNKEQMPTDELVSQAIEESEGGNNTLITVVYQRLIESRSDLDKEMGRKLIEIAVESGSTYALAFRGQLKSTGEWASSSECEYFDDYNTAAKRGLPQAMTALAIFYGKGECIQQNSEKANSLLLRASELDDPSAEAILGSNYIINGISDDEKNRGFELLDESVSHGSTDGAHVLAMQLIKDDPVLNSDKIFKLLAFAIDNYKVESLYLLARYVYLNPSLPVQLKEEAAKIVIQFPDMDDPEVKYAQATMFHIKELSIYDTKSAAKLFDESFSAGMEKAGRILLSMRAKNEETGLTDCRFIEIAKTLSDDSAELVKAFLERVDLSCRL